MGPVLLHTLTNALEEWTLLRFADDTTLGTALVCAGLPLRGTTTGWGNEPVGPSWNSWGQRQSPAPVKKQCTAWGPLGWSSSLLEEAMELLVGWQQKGPPATWAASARARLLSQAKGLSPSAQHSSDHIQNTAGIWAPQHNKDMSPGGSN